MPPWARVVADSSTLRLASIVTGTDSARCRATASPARPAPTMTTGSCASGEVREIGSDMVGRGVAGGGRGPGVDQGHGLVRQQAVRRGVIGIWYSWLAQAPRWILRQRSLQNGRQGLDGA